MQPQFVLSVGDLIDGKTYDSVVIEKQWREFNEMIQPLSMPFFYVPGNHDISNPWMEKEWKKRYGQAYYHFVYKNVLFLCINTEDGGAAGIQEAQISYFQKVIKENTQVRWTFLFMHRPVWYGDNEKKEGYEKIEGALKGRNYTLFSGHHHTYLNVIKNGNKHFVLGSTGGGSDLRGEKFGEFDHISLVTLNSKDSLKIINLKLEGMIKEDVVNETTFPITQTLINEDWVMTPTYVSANQFEPSISPEIIFNNPTAFPLQVSGNFPLLPGYKISPEKIDLVIPANSRLKQTIVIRSVNNSILDLSALPFIEIKLNGAYQFDTLNYALPSKKQLNLNWKYRLHKTGNARILIHNQFNSQDSSGFISMINPEHLENKWYWSGPDDAHLGFKLIRDSKYLYLLATVKDDQLVLESGKQSDEIYVQFEDKNGSPTRFNILPGKLKSSIESIDNTMIGIKDLQLKTVIDASGSTRILLQIPLDKIVKPDNSFRFNIGYRDQDNHPSKQHSIMFWKPLWGTETDYKDSGSFLIED